MLSVVLVHMLGVLIIREISMMVCLCVCVLVLYFPRGLKDGHYNSLSLRLELELKFGVYW